LGGETKAKYVRNTIAHDNVEVVCLQETKSVEFSDTRCFSLWGSNEVGWIHNEGCRGAGSLLVMWNKQAFQYESHVVGTGFIMIFGLHTKANLRCAVVNVYAACNMGEEESLWEGLTTLMSTNLNWAWCLCGDFNAVRCESERKGVSERGSQKKEIIGFNNFIESNFLVELPLVGKKYTWYRANGTTKSRLDRVLVSEEWLRKWPMAKQYILPREVSDHCTIVVKCRSRDWEPKPFRTIDAWQMEPGFKEMVTAKWSAYAIQGDNIIKIKDKLKCLKCDLKVWNKEVFGHMETERKRMLKEIEDLDARDAVDNLNDHSKERRLDLIGQVRVANKKIESLARQKARTNWLVHGDANSKYYHSVIRWRRLRNEVKGVHVGEQWCEELEVVRREAKAMFEERFHARYDFGVRLDNVQFKKLSKEDSESISLISHKKR